MWLKSMMEKLKEEKMSVNKAEYKWISLPLLSKEYSLHVQQFIIGGKTTGTKTLGLKTQNL